MHKVFRYQIKPTKTQETWFLDMLERCRELQNSALNGRKVAWAAEGKSLSFADQCRELTLARERDSYYGDVPVVFQQRILLRVDRSMDGFYRRVEKGEEKPGFPRYRSRNCSLSYPIRKDKNGNRYNPIRITSTRYDRLKVPKLDEVKVRLSRPLEGDPKECIIVKKADGWYVHITCEIDDVPKVEVESAIGIDVGLKDFLTTSNGDTVENPRFFREDEGLLRKHSQAVSRCQKDSNRREEAVQTLARHHKKTADKRDDFLAKVVNWIYYNLDNQLIAAEQLEVVNMAKNKKLSKSIYDAAWSKFFDWCASIAERDGLHFHQVDPRNTSQTCSHCGQKAKVKLELKDRTFNCSSCGFSLDRDHNAAINILDRAASVLRGERWVTTFDETQSCKSTSDSVQLSAQSQVARLG